MKHKVVSKFIDNETGRFYPINSFYEGEDAERVLFLSKEGLIEPNKNFKDDLDAATSKQRSNKSTNKKTGTKKSKDETEPAPEEVTDDE